MIRFIILKSTYQTPEIVCHGSDLKAAAYTNCCGAAQSSYSCTLACNRFVCVGQALHLLWVHSLLKHGSVTVSRSAPARWHCACTLALCTGESCTGVPNLAWHSWESLFFISLLRMQIEGRPFLITVTCVFVVNREIPFPRSQCCC
jgi:hypothetical protein